MTGANTLENTMTETIGDARIIHQVWVGANSISQRDIYYAKSHKRENPDWSLILWCDDPDRMAKLLPEDHPWDELRQIEDNPSYHLRAALHAIYCPGGPEDPEFIRFAAAWSDVVRLEVLDQHGGVYMDLDTYSITGLENGLLNASDTLVLCREWGHRYIGNFCIGVRRGHPVIRRVLDEIYARVKRFDEWPTDPPASPVTLTGPAVLGKVAMVYGDARIVPASVASSFNNRWTIPENLEEIEWGPSAVLAHMFAGSWLTEPPKREKKPLYAGWDGPPWNSWPGKRVERLRKKKEGLESHPYTQIDEEFARLVGLVAYCNLDERTDRRGEMVGQLGREGIVAHRISGIHGARLPSDLIIKPYMLDQTRDARAHANAGMTGVVASLAMGLQMALTLGSKTLLWLEDDAVIPNDFKRFVVECEQEIPADWDYINFGASERERAFVIRDNVVRLNTHVNLHCVLFHRRAFRRIIDLLARRTNAADVMLSTARDLRGYMHRAYMVDARPGYSDVTQEQKDGTGHQMVRLEEDDGDFHAIPSLARPKAEQAMGLVKPTVDGNPIERVPDPEDDMEV